MNYKNKNILFSIGLNITENKEFVEKYLNKKFNKVRFVKNMIDVKSKKLIFVKIFRELYRNFPKNSFFKALYDKAASVIYKKVIASYEEEFDYFLVVSNGKFSTGYLKELKRKYPNIKTVLYLWDKLSYTTWKPYVNSFDYVFTFDKNDAQKYGYYFRPTFYTGYNQNRQIEFSKRENSIYYVGLLRNIERYNIAKKLSDYMKKNALSSLIKIYVQNKQRKLDMLPKEYDKSLIIHEQISFYEDLENTRNSKVILDLNYGEQIGLTLRVHNALETNTKILTNNKDIVNYDFYNPHNIKLINTIEDIQNIDINFFIKEPVAIDKEILERYSVEYFIDEIMEVVDDNK